MSHDEIDEILDWDTTFTVIECKFGCIVSSGSGPLLCIRITQRAFNSWYFGLSVEVVSIDSDYSPDVCIFEELSTWIQIWEHLNWTLGSFIGILFIYSG